MTNPNDDLEKAAVEYTRTQAIKSNHDRWYPEDVTDAYLAGSAFQKELCAREIANQNTPKKHEHDWVLNGICRTCGKNR